MRAIERLPRPDAGADEFELPATEYLQVRDYLRILLRRRWIIVAIVALGLAAGAAQIWTTTPIYEAHATLQIDQDVNVLGVDRPLVPLDQRDWMREFLPTQLGILQSRELARIAHDELTRVDGSAAGEGYIPIPSDSAPTSHPADTGPVPSAAAIAAGRTVGLVRDSRLVNIGFMATDPALAARVANALARAYLQQNMDFRSKTSDDASSWLSQQVGEQRALVEKSEAALQQYREEHGADALMRNQLGAEQQNVVVQKLAELQAAETKARTETFEKQAQNAQLQSARASHTSLDSLPAIATNPYIQGLKGELTTLQRQLVQASQELGDVHPEMIKLRESVENAERKLQTEIAVAAAAIRNDFEAAQEREHALTAALSRQKMAVRELNGKTVKYTALEREATSNREVLDQLLQRSREAVLARQLQTTNVRIVDWAEASYAPIIPRTGRTMMMALVGSGILALGLVFTLELFNTRIKSPADVKQHLRIRVVGVVPRVKVKTGSPGPLLGRGAPAQFAELFQGLRTALMSTPELAEGRTLLITSSNPAEGKTMSAANIAVSLARLRQRVVLVDADLRHPRLHEVFSVDQGPGLADVLTSGQSSGVDFRRTQVSGLWLMPAGSVSQSPADLLGSPRFGRLVENLRKQFDWVVLDSPPVLVVTDPSLIARAVSGVLVVVDCDRTSREVVAATIDRLDSVGAPLVGAMLNRVEFTRDESYLPYYHHADDSSDPHQKDDFLPLELPSSAGDDPTASGTHALRG
jgi:capsular exopolysaccharide synthesis family protein